MGDGGVGNGEDGNGGDGGDGDGMGDGGDGRRLPLCFKKPSHLFVFHFP